MTTQYDDRLRADDWVVRDVDMSIARSIVEQYHYARSASNTATYLHGLFRKDSFWESECMGIAWWIPPTRRAAEATYPANWQGVLALSRLVILPDVPKNACTFLLARSRKRIDRAQWPCLVTYADEWQEHTGTIYRADNWQYIGKTKAERIYTIDGRMVSRKAGPKTRRHQEMIALGAQITARSAKHKFIHLVKGGTKP